jgi:tartrate dehydrogenase/decarboxylase/D-malate dehydrogenase
MSQLPTGAKPVRIGLAVGDGTGGELAQVFRTAVARLAEVHEGNVQISACPRRFSTYGGLVSSDASPTDTARLAESDAAAYADWLRESFRAGIRAVFRTAFNAQSVYLVREALWAVKPEAFTHPGGELLVIRDQTQGFYTGRNCDPETSEDRIERTCEFRRDRTDRVLDFARAQAEERWSPSGNDHRLVVAYKFHLLDRRFERWVVEYGRSRGVPVELYQPDTANRHMGRGLFHGNVVLVGANEWADIMHTELIARFGLGHQEERWSRSVYLAGEVADLEEYQTVHGSADDIAGDDRVNPSATLRAAAALLERHTGFSGALARMERALSTLGPEGLTPDRGGSATTTEVTGAALAAYAEDRLAPASAAYPVARTGAL